jgi:hypothetical protein
MPGTCSSLSLSCRIFHGDAAIPYPIKNRLFGISREIASFKELIMSSFQNPEHSVIIHADQMDRSQMEIMAEQARAAGFDPVVDEMGFYLGGLTESQADVLSEGLRQIGINPYGGVSY